MTPIQVTFRNLERSEAVADHIARQVEKLSTFCRRITSCHVTIEAPHRHRHGGSYCVHIDLTVPGHQFVVSHTEGSESSADAHSALEAAFEQAKRRLKDHAGRRRGVVRARP